MEDDEDFAPNCEKCYAVYGFTELLEENHLAFEIYQKLTSRFVQDTNIQEAIWQGYAEEIDLEGFDRIFYKLDLIYSLVHDHQKNIQEAQDKASQQKGVKQPTVRRPPRRRR